MDLGGWLRSLGLGQYEAAFRENEIDDTVLPNLTAEDLKDLGVRIVGHRRKLLDAITALRAETSAKGPPADALPPTDIAARETAERRQVTVMFSDLVGSTALSARMDPEDLREVISAYQKCVAETVRYFGGFVAQYLGDGVLVYFGYPQAHEDDAERAVRAGLALIAAVEGVKTRALLQTRVGIATGLVVVGDLIGAGEAHERGIVGETPNLAARLQAVAEPNRVVIAEGTRGLLGNLFELEELGARELKGITGPARAWVALRASSVESRFEALHPTGHTALVGREEETELLLRRWAKVKAGEGQVVLLSGEAGIGKSRLTVELMDRIGTESHTRLRYFCSPQHTDSALFPIIGQLERAARLAHEDKPEVKLDKLDTTLAQTSTSSQDAALFAEMLSLTNDGRYPTLEMTPRQRKQRTLEALTAQLAQLASQQPVLMIFEDANWIDPTSLQALDRAVDRIATLRVLLIVTSRPEFNAPWVGQSHVTSLTLNRLGRREASAIVARLAGNSELPADVMAKIVERTDGIPLFVEEMTKAVLESEGKTRRNGAALPSQVLTFPASLGASLMARLDRLGPAKEIAQIGAAIGRDFSHELLASVVQESGAELGSMLERIIEAGLLFRHGAPPHSIYSFKHALVRDVAYSSLLRGRRQHLHAHIAEAYENRFAETARTQPELIAHHFTEAGLIEAAIDYWQRAGGLAMARSAHAEAIRHFSTALDLLAQLTDAPNRAARELELCIELGPALMMAKGTARPEVEAIYIRAATLDVGEDSPERFKALWGLYYYLMTFGRMEEAARRADELIALARRLATDDLVFESHHAKWATSLWLGDLAATDANCQQGILRYDSRQHHGLAFTFSGHDPGVCAHTIGAISCIVSGFPDRAMGLVRQAIALARNLSHPYSLALAMWHWAIVLQIARQGSSCHNVATELIALSEEHDFPAMRGYGTFFSGWATADAGQIDEGIALMEQGLPLVASTGRGVTRPYMLGILACAKADLGNLPQAIGLVDEALRATELTGERWWEAELDHVRGRLALANGEHDTSEAYFQRSIGVSRRQGAKALELRTSTSLARLWREQGKHTGARDLLAPIYGWFTEGFDMPDLKEAKSLLEVLEEAAARSSS